MRRFVSFTGIFLLALFVSGWGSVVAASLCPHAGMPQPLVMAEDHSCCLAKLGQAGAHHQDAHREAAHGMKIGTASAARHLHGSKGVALSQPVGACTHCVGQNDLPATPASVQELSLQKREAGKIVALAMRPSAQPVAVSLSRFFPTQHAPPGRSTRKHLLLSVFLI